MPGHRLLGRDAVPMTKNRHLHPRQMDGIVDVAHFIDVGGGDIKIVFVGLRGVLGWTSPV